MDTIFTWTKTNLKSRNSPENILQMFFSTSFNAALVDLLLKWFQSSKYGQIKISFLPHVVQVHVVEGRKDVVFLEIVHNDLDQNLNIRYHNFEMFHGFKRMQIVHKTTVYSMLFIFMI